jgi:hypothetical protein
MNLYSHLLRGTIAVLVVFFNLSIGLAGSPNLHYISQNTARISDSLLIEKELVFKLDKEVDIETAKLIDDYLMKREGISFSFSNVQLKEIKIVCIESFDSELVEQLLRYAEHLFVKHEGCSGSAHLKK